MADYGLKIAKQGYDVLDAEPKDLIFSSSYSCLKIIQLGKVSAVNASEVDIDSDIPLPIVVLAFLYDSAISKYEPVEVSFSSTKLYFSGGEATGSYYYYYICYA
jgi:hypothetical protein